MTRQYRILYLAPAQDIAREEKLSAQDDLDALDRIETVSNDHDVELWEGLRKVARVKPHHAPLDAHDRFCL